MEQTQQELLLSQMWGSLSTCVTGAAAIISKTALGLNGLGARRAAVRMIDSGMDHQLGRLIREVLATNKKHAKDLQHVATGIAECGAKTLEFTDAGGGRISAWPGRGI